MRQFAAGIAVTAAFCQPSDWASLERGTAVCIDKRLADLARSRVVLTGSMGEAGIAAHRGLKAMKRRSGLECGMFDVSDEIKSTIGKLKVQDLTLRISVVYFTRPALETVPHQFIMPASGDRTAISARKCTDRPSRLAN